MIREATSLLAPAGKGTIRRIGRSGHALLPGCAAAAPAAIAKANVVDSSRTIRRSPWPIMRARLPAMLCPPRGPGQAGMDGAMGFRESITSEGALDATR